MDIALRVLLVEDSPDDAALIQRHLTREGVCDRVVRVDDAEGLRAALAAGLPDVVLCDFRLPRLTALEAVEIVRWFDPDLPVLVVSGTVGEEAAVEAMRGGARDFLLKESLARLTLAIRREVADARGRRDQRREREIALRAQDLARSGGFEWAAGGRLRLTEGAARLLEVPEGADAGHADVASRLLPGEEGRLWKRIQASEFGVDEDVRILTFLGREVVLRLVAEVERRDGQIVRVVGAIQDVTERRQLEAQLRMQDRLAAMGTIAAGVAHEINNPLTHLVASLPWLLANPPPGGWPDAETPSVLRDCVLVTDRIAAVVRDLKMWTRPEESAARCDLSEVVTSALHLLNLEYRHVATIEVDVVPDLTVALPSSRAAQVFANLLINAVQAMPPRAVAENRILVSVRAVGAEVVLTVADNGAGMTESVRSQVFAPFFTTKAEDGGTGLGLSICRDIVAGYGGRVTVESVVGRGSTFRVWLPRASAVEAAPPVVTFPATEARIWRVLVVDDEPLLRRLAQRVLRPHDVVAVASVDEALAAIAYGAAFDAILCDVMMPVRPGWELRDALVDRHPALVGRCLFTTGGAVTREAERFLASLPLDRVLLKPFRGDDLRAAVARIVGGEP